MLLGLVFYRLEAVGRRNRYALTVVLLVFLLTAFTEYTHHFLVDLGNYFQTTTTVAWQRGVQDAVVRLDPVALPHSYRFLPNAIVFWMQIAGVNFRLASAIYRSLFMLVLFYSLYRFGRMFTNHLGALLAMLLVALVYPVSFVAYAGQLTDPISHLSFLLAFIFLEADEFWFFLSALLIGSLAKETVLGMLGFYLLFERKKPGYVWKAPGVVATCLGAYFAVRTFVLHGAMKYSQVSGVDRAWILTNLKDIIWLPHMLVTLCAYLPFLVLGWKDTPLMLKRLVFYLLPLVLVSSLLFSWLDEARNYMPLVFVLAVVAGRYLAAQTKDAGSTLAAEA